MNDYDHSATQEYLRVVREHVIRPLDTTGVADSCFAAAILIFAAIDGLGKLTHPNSKASHGDGFKSFLPRLGESYGNCSKELWQLRNSLAHNAMNVACFMSKTEDARGEHLEEYQGYVFVHTGSLLDDFRSAVDSLEQQFRTDDNLLQAVESRLEWDSIDKPSWRTGGIGTTAPPGVRFARERRER